MLLETTSGIYCKTLQPLHRTRSRILWRKSQQTLQPQLLFCTDTDIALIRMHLGVCTTFMCVCFQKGWLHQRVVQRNLVELASASQSQFNTCIQTILFFHSFLFEAVYTLTEEVNSE